MYDAWVITRWETPVVDIDRLLMVSLTDSARELELLLESFRAPGRPRWRVRFRRYPAYRNIDEAYRTDLWRCLDESEQRVGFTFTVEESPPFSSWGAEHLHEIMPTIKHYVIGTEDDVVEVLSAEEPVWEVADPAPPDAPLPGKSEHLYSDEDKDEIQRLRDNTNRRQHPGDPF